MPCNQQNYDRTTGSAATATVNPGAIDSWSEPYLIVLDAPEKFHQDPDVSSLPLYSGAEGLDLDQAKLQPRSNTLYKAEIPVESGARTFRVFIWEESRLSSSCYLHLVLSFIGAERSITSIKSIDKASIDAADVCLAVATLYGTLDTKPTPSDPIGETEVSIWKRQIASDGFLGAVIEFTVAAGTACTLRFRSDVSSGTSIAGDWDDPVAWPKHMNSGDPVPKEHSRGWWPQSLIVMPSGTLDCNPELSGDGCIHVTVYRSKTGSEMTGSHGFAKNPDDTYGTSDGNDGCWSAKLVYEFVLSNSHSSLTGSANVWIQAKSHAAAAYWCGAARIEVPSGYPQEGVERIGNASSYWETLLSVTSSGTSNPIDVPPGGQVTLRVAVMNGGGSTLGVNLRVCRIPIS